MHIPDGVLDVRTIVTTSALSFAGLVVALRHAHRHLPRHRVPLVFLVKRLLVFEPFVLGVAFLALFQPDGIWIFLFIVIRCTCWCWTNRPATWIRAGSAS
jgi:hypothetical protein